MTISLHIECMECRNENIHENLAIVLIMKAVGMGMGMALIQFSLVEYMVISFVWCSFCFSVCDVRRMKLLDCTMVNGEII